MGLPVQIRWIIRRDMPEVLRIESESFDRPWTDEDFLCCLRQRNCIGMLVEHEHKVVAFMIYELHKTNLHILNFAVDPAWRRCGIGGQMVLRLVSKLSQQRRCEIAVDVRERNTAAQCFFRSQGFRAIGVLRGHYDDTGEDAYQMLYSVNSPAPERPWSPRNRISEYDAA